MESHTQPIRSEYQRHPTTYRLRAVPSPRITVNDEIIDNYANMINHVVAWAVTEAYRPKPVKRAVEFLNDFLPNWRELYPRQAKHKKNAKYVQVRRSK